MLTACLDRVFDESQAGWLGFAMTVSVSDSFASPVVHGACSANGIDVLWVRADRIIGSHPPTQPKLHAYTAHAIHIYTHTPIHIHTYTHT